MDKINKKGPKGYVKDLLPQEVSHVDYPANMRPYLITKGGKDRMFSNFLSKSGMDPNDTELISALTTFVGEDSDFLEELDKKLSDEGKKKLLSALKTMNNIEGMPPTGMEAMKTLMRLCGPGYGYPEPKKVSKQEEGISKEDVAEVVKAIFKERDEVITKGAIEVAEIKKEEGKMEMKCTKCSSEIGELIKSRGSVFCPDCGTENFNNSDPAVASLSKRLDALTSAVETLTKAVSTERIARELPYTDAGAAIAELTKRVQGLAATGIQKSAGTMVEPAQIEAESLIKSKIKDEKPGSKARMKAAEELINQRMPM